MILKEEFGMYLFDQHNHLLHDHELKGLLIFILFLHSNYQKLF